MESTKDSQSGILSGNQLKIIALVAMTCDHVGKQLLPQWPILQIVGRLAFPIFAYMIAEGCMYTRNRKQYLGQMVIMALLCQVVYYIAMGSLYQCVLVTFSLSIGLIYLVDYGREKRTWQSWTLVGTAFVAVYFLSEVLPAMLPHTDFAIDYGFWGILLPVLVYLADMKSQKLVAAAGALIILGMQMGGIQWYALGVLPLLALYGGKRGKWKMKNLFYTYYPLHLAGIYVLGLILF